MVDLQRVQKMYTHTGHEVHIIGVGATGSKVALSLLKLGVPGNKMHIYDFDNVESHNVANQVFGNSHVGMSKVEAFEMIANEYCSEYLYTHKQKVTSEDISNMSGIVFLLTDTMSSRTELIEALGKNDKVERVYETRLDVEIMYIHSLDPKSQSQINAFKDTLFDDDDSDVEVSACGTTIKTVISQSADILSGLLVWEYIRHCKNNDSMFRKTLICLNPLMIEEDIIKH